MKPHLDPDESKVTCDEKPSSGKVDPPSLTDKHILIEEKIENYAITNLPNEIIEMLLVDAVKCSKNLTETYVILPQTCWRFKRKEDALLPHIHMKFPGSVFVNLPRFHDKIKVSVREIRETFGPYSGAAKSLTEIVDDKK